MPPKKKPASSGSSGGGGGKKPPSTKKRPAAEPTTTSTKTKTTSSTGGTTTPGGTTSVRGYWSENEETALKRAVRKHGIGAWEKMRNDPEFVTLRCATRRDAGDTPPIYLVDCICVFFFRVDSFDDGVRLGAPCVRAVIVHAHWTNERGPRAMTTTTGGTRARVRAASSN